MNNWVGLCFLKSHGVFPLSETPWGLCCWKHCQLKHFHLQQLPQEWERIYRCCHTPSSESVSCWELSSSVPLSLGHLKDHEVTPCNSSTKTRANPSFSLVWISSWGAVGEGSSRCIGAEAAVVCNLGFSTQAPVQTGTPPCCMRTSNTRVNPSVKMNYKNMNYTLECLQ